MRMTRRLAITIAVVCGALAALLTYIYLSGLQKEQPVVTPQVTVVIPVETIESGTVITAEMVTVKTIPGDQVPPDAVRDVAQIRGDVAAEELPAGQPITRAQMASRKGRIDLSYVVPAGMRAVTVALDPITGVAGFLKPGDRVDVIATFKLQDTVITRTVLQNVELLALGETTIISKERAAEKEGEEEPKAKVQPNATLAVTPQDAQKLIVSDTHGTIRLALRRKGETEYKVLKATDLFSIVGVEFEKKREEEEQPMPPELAGPGPTEMEMAPGRVAVPPRPSVEVIRGTERETVTP